MPGDALLAAPCVCALGGVGVLRFAWSFERRSVAWNVAGWGLFALAAVAGWMSAGAWGVSIASICGMGMAMLVLVHAGVVTPVAVTARASNRRVNLLPQQQGEAFHLWQRIQTFLLVALAAMIVSIGLGIASRTLLMIAGAGEANASVAAFFVMPIAWGLLAFGILMTDARARQWRLLLLCAVPGAVAIGAGFNT